MTFQEFINLHKSKMNADGLRLGQRFMNTYIKDETKDIDAAFWSRLYNADDLPASTMIREWLGANHYFPDMPEPVR